MTGELGWQLLLLGGEAVVVAAVLLGLFRTRFALGLAPFYMALGALAPLQMLISRSLFIEVGPVLQVSPGSAVLFTGALFSVLLVYIREDALAARRLIYALLSLHLVLGLLMWLLSLHMDSPVVRNLHALSPELFVPRLRATAVGLVVLYADTLLIVLVFEACSRWMPRWFFLRAWLSMATVLTLDSVAFLGGTFFGHPFLAQMLASAVTGKVVAAGVFAAALTIYLRRLEPADRSLPIPNPRIRDLFAVLTYRQKYELLLAELVRDALTGVFNRAYFDQRLPRALESGRHINVPTSLVMVDIDHFKSVNDRFGHPTGDLILKRIALALSSELRESDFLCRYGGEEFAIVLPNANGAEALKLAERIRVGVAQASAIDSWLPDSQAITLTAGVATFPAEAQAAGTLVALADRRLYQGKHAGRNCVVGDTDSGSR